MTFVVDANLDIEARWAGGSLPGNVSKRVSLYGALVAALAAGDDLEIWTPAAIEPRRIVGMPPATYRVGRPARSDLAWASDTPAARATNDRRLVHTLGLALPGAFIASDISDIERACNGVGPRSETETSSANRDGVGPRHGSSTFVAKAPWTAAGRDRMRWTGALASDKRTYVERLLARQGAVVVEPWCERVLDVGICARVDGAGTVTVESPHGIVVDARGGFVGIDTGVPALEAAERDALEAAVHRVGPALAKLGYRGPFALDAFVYLVEGKRRFHAVCEINARHTFGFVAKALGVRRLMLAGTPPPDARLLITPGDDGVCAWVE